VTWHRSPPQLLNGGHGFDANVLCVQSEKTTLVNVIGVLTDQHRKVHHFHHHPKPLNEISSRCDPALQHLFEPAHE
jgi:hypothetical protein